MMSIQEDTVDAPTGVNDEGTKYWRGDSGDRRCEDDLPIEVRPDGMMVWLHPRSPCPFKVYADGHTVFLGSNSYVGLSEEDTSVAVYDGIEYSVPYWMTDMYSGGES